MTRSDKWKKRPAVMRYRAFADQVRALSVKLPEGGADITFFVQMPKSWSPKKQKEYLHTRHQQKPDLSNLLKALEDAVYGDDSHIWHYSTIRKLWSDKGGIEIA
jgi:Holliday junction resolvase RusA-like endonuclease